MLRLFFFLSSLIFISCNVNRKNTDQKIRSINIRFHYPEKLNEYKAEILVVDVYATYFENYILYELPYHETYSVDGKMIYDSLKYSFFIQNKDSSVGYALKKLSDTLGTKNKMGESAASLILKNEDLGNMFKIENIHMSDKTVDRVRGIDVYYFNDQRYDSAFFFYTNKLKDIPFTLSPTLDSEHNEKLYKVQLFMKKDTSLATRNLENFHIASWEIFRISVHDEVKKNFLSIIHKIEEKEKAYK